MLMEAVIENGQLSFLQPVKFVHDKFLVKVVIPEAEIESNKHDCQSCPESELPNKELAEFKHLTNVLFGADYRYIAEKSDQEILSEVLSDKYA